MIRILFHHHMFIHSDVFALVGVLLLRTSKIDFPERESVQKSNNVGPLDFPTFQFVGRWHQTLRGLWGVVFLVFVWMVQGFRFQVLGFRVQGSGFGSSSLH